LNFVQQYLHDKLEEQLEDKGWVRAIILKARQEGCSTYVGGRYYKKTSWEKGQRAFILTHRDDATNNLFKMTRRFHEYMPDPLRASTSYSSRQELVFDKMDSSYGLGTAGSGEIGRSDTIQLFHGSEVASWANADLLVAGIFEAIPDGPGTEVILESTAKGMGNFFHQEWEKAVAGVSDYMPIFIPWFWLKEYSRLVPDGFTLSDEDKEYQQAYKLTDGQMAWRQAKIAKMSTSVGNAGATLFKQEYPATAAEAFQTTGQDSYIGSEVVLRARKASRKEVFGPIVVGIDPATGTAISKGNDFTGFCIRQGPFIWSVKKHDEDAMATAGRCTMLLEGTDPELLKIGKDARVAKIFIDVGGIGHGVVSRLYEMGYRDRVTAVNFGSAAMNKVKYRDRRTEMWGNMKDWLEDEVQPVIPDNDNLHADITAPSVKPTSNGQLKLEDKESIRKRLGRSTDEGDAVALTFAQPVRDEQVHLQTRVKHSFKMMRGRPEAGATQTQIQRRMPL